MSVEEKQLHEIVDLLMDLDAYKEFKQITQERNARESLHNIVEYTINQTDIYGDAKDILLRINQLFLDNQPIKYGIEAANISVYL